MSEYINKLEAYRLLENMGDSLTLSCSSEPYYEAADMIYSMKAADVKPVVRAEWRTGTGILKFACSECSVACLNKTNFCPHCGADMRGEAI